MRLSTPAFIAALLVGPLFSAAPASAGDLIPELVPADSRWVAHIDVEGFLGSSFWMTLRAEPEFALQLDQGLSEAREELGFNPLELVKSVTAFGTTEDPEDAIAVLVVSEAADGMLAKLREQPMYSAQQVGGYAVDVWSEDGDDESVFCHVREFQGISNRLVFLSGSSERLMQGIAVLDDQAADITKARDSRISADPQKDSFFYFETGDQIPGLDQIDPVSAVAALAKGMRFEVGEAGGALFADLRLTTQNGQDAQQVHSVLEGATSLLNLMMPAEVPDEIRQLVRGLQFATNGNQVGIEFRHNSADLIAILRRLQELDR